MPYSEETSYFEVAQPGDTIAYKDIDYLLKNDKYTYPYLFYKA